MDLNEYFDSKILRWSLGLLAALIVVVLVFAVGARFGLHRQGLGGYKGGVSIRQERGSFGYFKKGNINRGNFYGGNMMRGSSAQGKMGRLNGSNGGLTGNLGNGSAVYSSQDIINAFSGSGKISKIAGNTLTIKGVDNTDKIINVNSKTVFKNADKDIKLSDLKINDQITAVGVTGDNGQMSASIVRVYQ